MYTLVSKWYLKAEINIEKLPSELEDALKNAAQQYTLNEPGTLMYLVNIPVKSPFNPEKPIENQVVFIEGYEDKSAFEKHVNGSLFKQFVKDNIQYFQQENGQPKTDTVFLKRESGSLHINL